MAELTTEEFENKCMDLIEKIVSISPKQNRDRFIRLTANSKSVVILK